MAEIEMDHIYSEYIRGILLNDILETELQSLISANSATNLQSIADNLVTESVDDTFHLMNSEILALAEDIERMESLQENLIEMIPRIMSLSWMVALNQIQHLLHQRTSTIPVENGACGNMDICGLIQSSDTTNERDDSPTVYNLKCLEESYQLLEAFDLCCSGARTTARDMNKILLKCISSMISRVTKGSMASG